MQNDLTNKPPAEDTDLIHVCLLLYATVRLNVLTIGHYLVTVLTVDLVTVGTGGAFSSKDV